MASAALLIIGSEITKGKVRDSHGKFLADLLSAYSVELDTIRIIKDGIGIASEIGDLVGRVDLLVVTGGLGPTSDDLTRSAVAAAAGVALRFSEELWTSIRRIYGHAEPPESNKRQAEIPEGFLPIHNTCGTAPGFSGAIGGTKIVAMPGPPRELSAMSGDFLEGYLREQFGAGPADEKLFTSFLISESLLEDYFQETAGNGDYWRTQAEGHRILIGVPSDDNQDTVADGLFNKFGRICIREGETTVADALSNSLRSLGKQLVTAESCTGGLIGKMITDLSGSSSVFWGGFITYANDAKERTLNVDTIENFGAVSRETVVKMADGALSRSTADVAISVSGIAGPEGGTAEKPVGTVWIAVQERDSECGAWQFCFRGGRDRVRLKSALVGMLLAEAAINHVSIDNDPIWTYI